MYCPTKDADKIIEACFSAILAEEMEPGKRRLLSEMYELNRQVRKLKKQIQEEKDPGIVEELKQQKMDLQFEILDYMDALENYKNLI